MLLSVASMVLVPQPTLHGGSRRRTVPTMAVAAPPDLQLRLQISSTEDRHAAFSEIVDRCENFAEDFESFLGVAEQLRDVFDADFEQYQLQRRSDASSQNVTCLRPTMAGLPIRGDGLVNVETEAGRICCDDCTDACSRVVVPGFAAETECAELCTLAAAVMEDDLSETAATQLSLASAAYHGSTRLTLLMVRQVEKLRRAVAHEYGLPHGGVSNAPPWQWRRSLRPPPQGAPGGSGRLVAAPVSLAARHQEPPSTLRLPGWPLTVG